MANAAATSAAAPTTGSAAAANQPSSSAATQAASGQSPIPADSAASQAALNAPAQTTAAQTTPAAKPAPASTANLPATSDNLTSATGYAAQLASQQAGNQQSGTNQNNNTGGDPSAGNGKPSEPVLKVDVPKDATAPLPTAVKTADASQLPAAASAVPNAAPAAAGQVSAPQTVANNTPAIAASVIQQIAVRVSKAVVDGIDHINVKLNPPELGHVEVRMEIGPSGHFNAVFAADRPQTVDLLQRHAHELTRSLQDNGVRTDSGSLSFNLREQNQQNGQTLFAGRPGSAASWKDDDADAAASLPVYAASTVGTGRVDIRV